MGILYKVLLSVAFGVMMSGCGQATAALQSIPTPTFIADIQTPEAMPETFIVTEEAEAAISIPAARIAEAMPETFIDTKETEAATSISAQPGVESSVSFSCKEWETFTSIERRFSISFPCEWENRSTGPVNSFLFDPETGGTPTGPYREGLMYFWVNIQPQGQTFENGGIYNYMTESFLEDVSAMAVGESIVKEWEGTELAKYWTFTRLADRMVSGHAAAIIENEMPWEFMAGTRDRRAVLLVDGVWYVVGGYSNTDDGQALFEAILDTFSVTE